MLHEEQNSELDTQSRFPNRTDRMSWRVRLRLPVIPLIFSKNLVSEHCFLVIPVALRDQSCDLWLMAASKPWLCFPELFYAGSLSLPHWKRIGSQWPSCFRGWQHSDRRFILMWLLVTDQSSWFRGDVGKMQDAFSKYRYKSWWSFTFFVVLVYLNASSYVKRRVSMHVLLHTDNLYSDHGGEQRISWNGAALPIYISKRRYLNVQMTWLTFQLFITRSNLDHARCKFLPVFNYL